MAGKLIALGFAALAFAAATPAVLSGGAAQAVAARGEHGYGAHPRQRLDYHPANGSRRAPVILFVHGGGWTAGDKAAGGAQKPLHFTARGFAYASVNYRLVPDATVEDQAADIAAAIAWLRGNARRLAIDPGRIVLMGHSSGAHLAALVASDPRYLRAAGVPFDSVRAAILLDGAGYDVAAVMKHVGAVITRHYEPAFGPEPARRRRLSPIAHAGAPNVPAWLFLYDYNRIDAGAEAEALARPLRAAGTTAIVTGVMDTTHNEIVAELGFAGDFATQAVDDFLAAEVATPGGSPARRR